MEDNKIVYIDVNDIVPHPNNPRKDLGDLTELAESIKMNGILQNLTVVPAGEGQYMAIIGHRRLAAAQLAGLNTVPCIVADMDEKTQVRTMMVENMQRSDLTVYEQAEGFQMMLDLGDSVNEIAERTGFSESTVRHRVKLLDLDKEKFRKAVDRGGTLQDYIKLEQIKDPERKNKVLEKIGTRDFDWELKRAIDDENVERRKTAALPIIETFATQIERGSRKDLKWEKSYYLRSDFKVEVPEDATVRNYYFTMDGYNITVYVEKTEEDHEIDAEKVAKEQQRRERIDLLNHLAEMFFEMRYDFVKNLTGLKKLAPQISELTIRSILRTEYSASFNDSLFMSLLGLDEDNIETTNDLIREIASIPRSRLLLAAAYANMGDDDNERYHNWRGEHEANADLDELYELLGNLGYVMSEEEQAYQNGTHELFTVEGEER